jgi:two-component system cell cycle sensor histidine kinase/response regulator CckA
MLRDRPGLPIIMATGFSEEITPEVARNIGISEFVYKPILGNDLARAVRAAIDGAAVASN